VVGVCEVVREVIRLGVDTALGPECVWCWWWSSRVSSGLSQCSLKTFMGGVCVPIVLKVCSGSVTRRHSPRLSVYEFMWRGSLDWKVEASLLWLVLVETSGEDGGADGCSLGASSVAGSELVVAGKEAAEVVVVAVAASGVSSVWFATVGARAAAAVVAAIAGGEEEAVAGVCEGDFLPCSWRDFFGILDLIGAGTPIGAAGDTAGGCATGIC
jgi:hypothetical protein